jgi:peptidyl-prolyl cis-trans isomerase D
MLNALRSSAGSIVIKGLLVLLALSFVVWGVTDYVGGGGSGGAVAEVGDTRVEPRQFMRALDQDVTRLRSVFGPGFTRDQARALGVVDQTVGRLVGEALIAEEADGLGVAVDDEIVRRNVTRDEAFQGLVGGFDRSRFRQIAANLGYSEQGLLERFRAETARDQVLGAAVGGLTAPRALAEAVARHRLQTRQVAFITLPPLEQVETPPTDADLRAFYDADTDRFTVPERRAVSLVSVTPADLARTVEVTEGDLAEAFDIRKDSFQRAQQRRVRQMIVADESAARAAKARLDGGEAFDAVAADVAGMDATATDLGVVTRDGLLPDLADAAFALDVGQTTQPIKTAFGWHIVLVSEIQGGEAPTLDDVRTELEADLRRERAADEVYAVSTELEDAIADGATLEEAAARLNLPLTRIEALAEDGTDGRGTPVDGLPGGGRAVIEEAFQADVGLPSVLLETGGDGYAVVRVDAVLDPELPPFDAVRADVEAAWRAEALAEQEQQRAETLRGRLSEGVALSAIAAEVGLDGVAVSPPVRRDGQVDTARAVNPDPAAVPGRGLIEAAFAADAGAAVMAPTGGRYQVGTVEAVTMPETDGSPAFEALAADVAQRLQADVLAGFSLGLQDKYTVRINGAVIDTLLGAGQGDGS